MSSPFAEYASAIGFVCMQWSFLEVMIDQLLLTLLPIERGKIGEVVTSNVDIRGKIRIATAVGFEKRPDDKWFSDLQEALDSADNELRSKRNRYAHDLWTLDRTSAAVKKLRFHAVLKKRHSHKPLELTTLHETEVKPQEIWDTADRITEAAATIALLEQQYRILLGRALPRKST
jgi:hypothetical protein